MTSLLHSLIFDNSSTVCTIALTVLIKLLPIFAIKACQQLKSLLPLLLVVLARILCWKERQSSSPIVPVLPDPDEDDEDDALASDDDEDVVREGSRPLQIREDIEWERLELTFDGPASKAPSPDRYFTFLYYLFPCNVIRFLRCPVRYLTDNGVDSLYAVEWEEALDAEKIKSKSEVRTGCLADRRRLNERTAVTAQARLAPAAHLARSVGRAGAAGLLGLGAVRHRADRRRRDHARSPQCSARVAPASANGHIRRTRQDPFSRSPSPSFGRPFCVADGSMG